MKKSIYFDFLDHYYLFRSLFELFRLVLIFLIYFGQIIMNFVVTSLNPASNLNQRSQLKVNLNKVRRFVNLDRLDRQWLIWKLNKMDVRNALSVRQWTRISDLIIWCLGYELKNSKKSTFFFNSSRVVCQ